jgi:hypothetical protein
MGHSRTSDEGLMASRRTAPPRYGVGGSIIRRVCTRPADTERLLRYLYDGRNRNRIRPTRVSIMELGSRLILRSEQTGSDGARRGDGRQRTMRNGLSISFITAFGHGLRLDALAAPGYRGALSQGTNVDLEQTTYLAQDRGHIACGAIHHLAASHSLWPAA